MDRRLVAMAARRQVLMASWSAAHQVLVDHQPVRRRMRRARCVVCGGRRYPCVALEQALDELTGGQR